MASERRPMALVPYDRREALTLREAARLAGRCESTVRGWCGMSDLGRRVGNGPWQVSRVALAMFLDGAADALRAYLAGDRTGVATNKPATNEDATNAKPARTANRRTPEAFREYQRTYMAKRRAAAKVTGPADRAALAVADA